MGRAQTQEYPYGSGARLLFARSNGGDSGHRRSVFSCLDTSGDNKLSGLPTTKAAGLLILILCALIPWARAASCPSNSWGLVYNGNLNPVGDNGWHGAVWVDQLDELWMPATDRNSITPLSNVWTAVSTPQTTCNQTSNPFTIRSSTGASQAGYNPIADNLFIKVGGTALSGGVCDGAAPTASSSTICLVGTSSIAAWPATGAVRIDGEVMEYTSFSLGTGNTSVQLSGLTRGSRQQAGNSVAIGHLLNAGPVNAVSPNATEATPGMQINTGSGFGPVTAAGSDMPFPLHPSKAQAWDGNAGRIWQVGGWDETYTYGDLWYWCIPGVTSNNGKCTAAKVTQGWIRVPLTNPIPSVGNPHYEMAAAYDSTHDAIYTHGSDAGSDTLVYCDTTNAAIACTGGTFTNTGATCINTSLQAIACPSALGGGAMIWDPDDKVLLFFGGGPASGSTGYNGAIWAYSPDGTNTLGIPQNKWEKRADVTLAGFGLSCNGALPPNVCRWPAFTYDTNRHFAVLFAGPGLLLKYTPSIDTWANTGVASGASDPPGPVAGVVPNLVYDATDDEYIFQSQNGTTTNPTLYQLPASAVSQITQNVELTVQAGVWPGSPAPVGSYPIGSEVKQGFPIPDSWNITCSGGACAPGLVPDKLQLCTTNNCSSGRVNSQFYVESIWPDGNAQWVKIDLQTQNLVTTTAADTSMFLVGGAACTGGCNFPASNLATDGASITVNTGVATFTIKKSNFDGFHSVVMGATTLVDPARTIGDDGLVLFGPPIGSSPNAFTCNGGQTGAQPGGATFTAGLESGCNQKYLSNLDAGSTAVIEENGPVRTTIKVSGSFASSALTCKNDGSGSTAGCYLHYTDRLTFTNGSASVKQTVELRNADFPTSWPTVASTDPNVAYKQFASFYFQVTDALSGTRSVTIGNAGGTATVSLPGPTDFAYLYQGYSNQYESGSDWNKGNCSSGVSDGCVVSPIHRTGLPGTYSQDGFKILSSQTITGTAVGDHTQYPAGWADEQTAAGAGVEIGVYQFAAYWPKELKYSNGGGTVQIGIWPNQADWVSGGDQPYVMQAYAHITHDIYTTFHTSALSSASDSFLQQQQHLLARATRTFYNSAVETGNGLSAIMYPLIDPRSEDSYYTAIGMQNVCLPGTLLPGECLPDIGSTQGNSESFYLLRYYDWSQGGGSNQEDNILKYLRGWMQRGRSTDGNGNLTNEVGILGSVPGRYYEAKMWARFQADTSLPHSDWVGGWRCQTINSSAPISGDSCPALTTPPCGTASTTNGTKPCVNLDSLGYFDTATIGAINGGQRDWADEANNGAHLHIGGQFLYYLISGDETIKDALQSSYKDAFTNQFSTVNNAFIASSVGPAGTCPFNASRKIGHRLMAMARESLFLRGLNDPEKDTIAAPLTLKGMDSIVEQCIEPDVPLPADGEGEANPAGCTAPYLGGLGTCVGGTSRNRGYFQDATGASGSSEPWTPWPANNPAARMSEGFFESILANGLHDYRQAANDLRGQYWYKTAPVAGINGVTESTGDLPVLDLEYMMGEQGMMDLFANPANNTAQVDYVTAGFPVFIMPDHLNTTDSATTCSNEVGGTISHGTCTACSRFGDCGHICPTTDACAGGDHGGLWFGLTDTTGVVADIAGNSTQKDWDMYLLKQGVSASRLKPVWQATYWIPGFQGIFNHNPAAPNTYTQANTAFSLQLVPNGITVAGCAGTGCSFTATQCNLGSAAGTCTLTWTPPNAVTTINGITYRLKFSSCTSQPCTPKAIVPWLAFHSNCLVNGTTYPYGDSSGSTTPPSDCQRTSYTNAALTIAQACVVNTSGLNGCYEINPASNINWSAATNVPDPAGLNTTAPASGASSYIFNGAANTSYSFSLSAFMLPQAGGGAPPVQNPNAPAPVFADKDHEIQGAQP